MNKLFVHITSIQHLELAKILIIQSQILSITIKVSYNYLELGKHNNVGIHWYWLIEVLKGHCSSSVLARSWMLVHVSRFRFKAIVSYCFLQVERRAALRRKRKSHPLKEIHKPAALKTNHLQACIGTQERRGRSHFSNHRTICSNMANKIK